MKFLLEATRDMPDMFVRAGDLITFDTDRLALPGDLVLVTDADLTRNFWGDRMKDGTTTAQLVRYEVGQAYQAVGIVVTRVLKS